MKALVIGFGSIGQKHSLILKNLGLDVAILSNFNSIDYKSFDDLDDSINNFNPDYIII
jgi:phosphoglycerate dehydrogenase-like enzyme